MIDVVKQTEKFKEFFEINYKKELSKLVTQGKKSILVNFKDLIGFDIELADELLSDPEETIKSAEISLEQFDFIKNKLRARFYNLPESQKIMVKDLRSINLNNLIVVEGIVRQASEVRPEVVSAKFECPSCGNSIFILQLDTKFKEPNRCSCGRKGRFRLISKELIDAQHLTIEESPESLEGGEQPKRISVFLKEDLVEPKMEKRTTPGSRVRAIGVIKEIPIMLKSGMQSTRYNLIMESNFIEPMDETFEEVEVGREEEEKIKTLAKDPEIYNKLINSIAPSIYGHDDIKAALILQMVGGIKKIGVDKTVTRGDIHLLLVGDPGSGKSRTLQFITKIAPKGRFISGKSASAAGITATVVRDEFLRGWALEAGAMVLANKGIAIIDELDKMSSEDRDALHEAMEQQQITINKANIQATLRAETTVLAAANPKLGRFDPYQSIAAQIELPPTLINRFDLIFPIRDIPNQELDEKIAGHVLRLQQKPEELKQEIDSNLLKKYISYVRQKSFPKLTDAAIDEIKKFYVGLRNYTTTGEESIKPIPITARQLEALVRLSEASAKIRLSNKVTREDAKRAINILKHCLMQVGFDYETGRIDIDRISTGIPASQRSRIVVIREIINDFYNKGIKTIPLEDLTTEAANKNITEDQVEEVIETLKRSGEIYEPTRNKIAKVA